MLTSFVDAYNSARKAVFDNLFKAPVSIDTVHHEVHEGHSYTIATFADGVVDDASLDMAITTPSGGTWGHFIAEVDFVGEHELYVYQGSTIADGTPFIPKNKNRNFVDPITGIADASIMTVVVAPTVSIVGDELAKSKAGSGTNPVSRSTGQILERSEWLLKADETYVFRVTNKSGATGYIAPTINWYEHTNE